MQLKKGDPCRVRLHTGEVVDAVYSHASAVHYKSHYVDYEGKTLRTSQSIAWYRDAYSELCRFVGPPCDHVDILPMGGERMSHTKEPWSIDEYGRVKADGCNEFLGVQVDGFSLNGGEESKSNARRIVACINACAGLSTDDLEKTGLVSAVGHQLLNADKERDTYRDLCVELLGSLRINREAMSMVLNGETLEWHTGNAAVSAHDIAIQSITKAESILGEKNGTAN